MEKLIVLGILTLAGMAVYVILTANMTFANIFMAIFGG